MTSSKPWREELRNIVNNAPVWPGDTLSHETARWLSRRWLIRRKGGEWVPTWLGVFVHRSLAVFGW